MNVMLSVLQEVLFCLFGAINIAGLELQVVRKGNGHPDRFLVQNFCKILFDRSLSFIGIPWRKRCLEKRTYEVRTPQRWAITRSLLSWFRPVSSSDACRLFICGKLVSILGIHT